MRWSPGRSQTWRDSHADPPIDPGRYYVTEIGEAPARTFTLARHYAGTWVSAKLRYGLFDTRPAGQHGALFPVPELVGAAVLSIPGGPTVLSSTFPRLIAGEESLELGRLVLEDAVPANAETWFLAEVRRQAGAAGIRGIVSYADGVPRVTAAGQVIMPGHQGTIYQAFSCLYLGRAAPRTHAILPDGRVLSPIALAKARTGKRGWAYAERQLTDAGAAPRRPGQDRRAWVDDALCQARAVKFRHPGVHKYVFAAGPKLARRFVITAAGPPRPYPKATDPAPAHAPAA